MEKIARSARDVKYEPQNQTITWRAVVNRYLDMNQAFYMKGIGIEYFSSNIRSEARILLICHTSERFQLYYYSASPITVKPPNWNGQLSCNHLVRYDHSISSQSLLRSLCGSSSTSRELVCPWVLKLIIIKLLLDVLVRIDTKRIISKLTKGLR